MSSKHYTSQDGNKKQLPFRRTGCITCDEGYMDLLPAPYDPRALREKFRRRPFGAPKKTPYQMLDTLNHEDIASLPPAVVSGQEAHSLLTDFQRRRLEHAQRGFHVPEDDKEWERTFLLNVFQKVLTNVLKFVFEVVNFIGKGVQWLFDIVSSGPFLPVFTSCSIYWWCTSTGAEPFWFQFIVTALAILSCLSTWAKYFLGR